MDCVLTLRPFFQFICFAQIWFGFSSLNKFFEKILGSIVLSWDGAVDDRVNYRNFHKLQRLVVDEI